jgi:hypothetical protein
VFLVVVRSRKSDERRVEAGESAYSADSSLFALSTLSDLQKGEASCIKIDLWDAMICEFGRLNERKCCVGDDLCHDPALGKNFHTCVVFGGIAVNVGSIVQVLLENKNQIRLTTEHTESTEERQSILFSCVH